MSKRHRSSRRPILCLLILLLVASARSASAGEAAARELIGVWEARHVFGPAVEGPLIIGRDGDGWSAEIAGHAIQVLHQEGLIHLQLPGGRGEFRGRVDPDGEEIVGHWVQPETNMNGVAYATPVHLGRESPDHWRGELRPLTDQMTLYLVVEDDEDEDGSIGAFIRNPEKNVGIFLRDLRLERDEDGVRILGRFPGEDERQLLAEGTLDAQSGRLSIRALGDTFDFTRLPEDGASDFHPRWRTAGRYEYRPPITEDDGWEAAALAEVGIAPEPMRELIQTIIDTPTESIFSPYVHSLLVARHGKLVLEEYFHGFHRDTPHDTRSSSKSITSALVGIALLKGAPFDVSSSVYEIMSDGRSSPQLDPRKRAMTVEHLLTMNSGYDCDVNDPDSPGNEDTMQQQSEELDWHRFTLDLPMARAPGEKAVYCSANANLLGGVLSQVTGGSWLPEYFHQHYAKPLGIRRYHMNLMPTGQGYMGGGLYLRARDFLKLGQVFLDDGEWNGQRLVSANWVRRSTASIEDLNDQGYGYLWWVISYPYKGGTVRAFYSGGNGGQMVIVLPELDLVVSFFAGNYGHFASLLKFRDEYVSDYLLRAVEAGEGVIDR